MTAIQNAVTINGFAIFKKNGDDLWKFDYIFKCCSEVGG
jgi:hypothetical protein